jgi:hypothetical protein
MNDTIDRPVFVEVSILEISVLYWICCLFQDLDIEAAMARMDGGGADGGEVYLPSGLPTQWLADPVVFLAVDDSDDDTVVCPSGLSRSVRFNEVSFEVVLLYLYNLLF